MKNIAIIGAGPAGYPCALKAAKLGAQVTLIESGEFGGVCLNCGCIPSKALLAGAHCFNLVKELEKYSSDPALGEEYFKTLSFSKLQEHSDLPRFAMLFPPETYPQPSSVSGSTAHI